MRPPLISSALLLLLNCISVSHAANILCLFTSTGKSHMIINMAIARTLVDRGHNVTVVTTLPTNDKNPKYHHIYIPPNAEDYAEFKNYLSTSTSRKNVFQANYDIFFANVARVRAQDKATKSPQFQELLNNPGNKFDVMIMGWVFNTYQLGFAAHFKCPVILTFINHPTNLLLSLVGSPPSIATNPCIFPYDLSCFLNRVRNVFFNVLWTMFEEFGEYKMGQYYEEYFPADKYPSFDVMKKNVSLIFCASHFIDGRIRPLTPAFIEIGGIQIKEKPDRLPADVEDFIKDATEGFILFSLGTNVKTSDISSNATSAMFKVLSQCKYKVLWKWDTNDQPGNSSNIMFRNWLPQDDLLAHPKIKLFISHAGKGSSVEAQYHGVPILAIPVYGDQPGNAREIAAIGYGLIVDHTNVTEQSFRRDFYDILENPRYRGAVTKFSKMYRDRLLSPRESVVYWTEYVIRHRGAKHMQSPAVHLNIFQKNSLDVLAFLSLIAYLSFLIVRKLSKIVGTLIFKTKLKSE